MALENPTALRVRLEASVRAVRSVVALAALGVVIGFTTPAHAAPQYYVELPPTLDRSVTLRTIALELREVNLPGDPRRAGDSASDVSLFIRISEADGQFLIELWDRGEPVGSRRISNEGHPSVLARRIALATVELTRQLSATRARSQKQLERQERIEREQERAWEEHRLLTRTRLFVDVEALVLPDAAFLIGPSLGVVWNRDWPFRLRLDGSYRSGAITTSGLPSTNWSAVEARVVASRVTRFGPVELETGGLLTFDWIHVLGAGQVDDFDGQKSTWTSRVGLELAGSYPIDDDARLRLGLEGGLLLRAIPLGIEDRFTSLGAGFIGVGFGLVAAP